MSRIFYIDNTEVYIHPSWSISDKINARTTMTIKVVELLTLGEINIGDSVRFEDNSIIIFAGIVQTISISEPYPNFLEYQLKCVDNSALANKILVAESGTNETAGYVVENVILPYLADEGVTTGNIEAGITISKYTFNYIKCSEALDKIKTISGLNWNIDKDKKLNLFSSGSVVAPFVLGDLVQHSKFKQSKSLNQYRNVQFVRAGKGKTTTQTDNKPTPKPDGVSRAFILKYPVAEKPSSIKINTVAVADSDIEISGGIEGKKYYYAIGSNVINQDDGETLLTDSDTIEVTYKGLYDILVQAEDEVQIAERKSFETGTSGRYENIVEEASITESDEALDYGQGLLTKYGEVADNVTFNTDEIGLEAGQLLSIDKTLYSIDADFLIESVNIKASGPNSIIYTIKCLDGASLGGWEEYFKDILSHQKTYVISENEILIKLIKLSDNFTMNESFSVVSGSPESRVGFAQVGFSEVV